MAWEFWDEVKNEYNQVHPSDPINNEEVAGDYFTAPAGWSWDGGEIKEGQKYRRVSDNSNTINIPSSAYPKSSSNSTAYTGLPKWGLNIVKDISANLPGLMDSYSQSVENLGEVPGLLDNWVLQSGDALIAGFDDINSLMRTPMNKLAANGTFDSTMLRDAFTGIGGLLADDYKEHQLELGAEANKLKADNLVKQATLQGSAVNLGKGILDLARATNSNSSSSTTNELAYWELVLDTFLN